MPLDTSIFPKSVTATLHYLQRTAQRPVRYVGEPPPGAVSWDGIDDPRDVLIEDGRGRVCRVSVVEALRATIGQEQSRRRKRCGLFGEQADILAFRSRL